MSISFVLRAWLRKTFSTVNICGDLQAGEDHNPQLQTKTVWWFGT